jgi:hypothetical protein
MQLLLRKGEFRHPQHLINPSSGQAGQTSNYPFLVLVVKIGLVNPSSSFIYIYHESYALCLLLCVFHL